jgi:hypothetical protein
MKGFLMYQWHRRSKLEKVLTKSEEIQEEASQLGDILNK